MSNKVVRSSKLIIYNIDNQDKEKQIISLCRQLGYNTRKIKKQMLIPVLEQLQESKFQIQCKKEIRYMLDTNFQKLLFFVEFQIENWIYF